MEKPDLAADDVILPMRSGDTADPKEIRALVEDLKQLFPGPPKDETEEGLLHLYGAMIEAMVNVKLHAYPKDGVFMGNSGQTLVDDRCRR